MEPIKELSEPKTNYSGRNLLLIFFALSASILVVGSFVFRNSEKNFRAEINRQLSGIADLRVSDLQLWRKERLGDGDVLFKNPSITRLVDDFFGKSGDPAARHQLLMWFKKEEQSYHYDRVWLLDAQGVTRLTSPLEAEPAPLVISKHVAEVLKSRKVILQDFYRDERDKRVYMGVLIPLFDESPAHQPLGVIDLRIDPEIYIYPYLEKWPFPSLTGETAILRREGDQAVLLNESRFQKNTALNVRAPMTRTDLPAIQALLGKEGIIDAVGYEGKPVVAALRTIPDSPWALVVRRDTSEVYAPMRSRTGEIVAMMVVLLFGAGAGVGMIWRGQNSRLYQERAESLEERVALNIRYRQFFEATRDGVLILETSTGKIVDANPYLIELLGYERDALVGEKIWNQDTFKKLAANKSEFLKFTNKDPTEKDLLQLETKDGRPILVEFACHGYRVKDQDLTQFNFHDITARLKAENEVRRSELFFRAVIENALDGVTIIEPDGNIRYTSPAVKSILGYEVAEMVQTNGFALIHPEDVQKVGVIFQEVLSSPEISRIVEFRYKHKDGTWRILETAGKSHFFTDPDFQGVVLNYRDVTERKKNEDAFLRSERSFKALIEQSPDGMGIIDQTNRIRFVNPSFLRMVGYESLEEIIGRSPMDFLEPETQEVVRKRLSDINTKGGVNRPLECRLIRKDGGRLNAEISSFASFFEGEQVVVSIARDITERKKAEEALKKHEDEMRLAQKMDAIGRLAGGVAHDFNNLLSVVSGNAEFIRRNLESGHSPDEELEDILMAVHQGAELTKQLLVFGKKQVSQPEPISLNQVCVEMGKMFRRLIDPKIELHFIQDKEQKFIQADQGQMQQVILNLVINARDAMPQGGKLTIQTDHLTLDGLSPDPLDKMLPGPYVRLKVTDTGAGMSPEIQQRIFEPFFTTKADKGTGLGLATVYAIVKNWAGTIFVHSVPGAGSTFTLYFPVLDRVDGSQAEVKQGGIIPMGSETILIAEDQGSFRKVLVRDLERNGYKVLQGENGVEALDAANRYGETIDLLLTDTVMPKMNGKQLMDELKKTRPDIKAIFISGYAQDILSEQGILDSGIHLIQKPFSLDFLLRQLRKVLEEK